MNIKEQIVFQFYELHEKPIQIANALNVVPSYITKIIQKDKAKYISEKEYRSKVSKEQRKIYKSTWNKRKSEETRKLNEFVKKQHEEASAELSYHTNISNMTYKKWNPSLYHYTNSGKLVIDRNIPVSNDIVRKINTNIKIPTQKYKKPYYFSVH